MWRAGFYSGKGQLWQLRAGSHPSRQQALAACVAWDAGPWACILCSDCEPLLSVLLAIALEEQTTLFKPAPAGRRLGCFQVRGVVFKAAVTVWVQAVGTCLFSSLR